MHSLQRSALGILLLVTLLLLSACGPERRFASHMRHGQEYFDHGDYSKASIEFRNALRILPKNASAAVMAGRAAEKLGKPNDAVGFYQTALDSAPNDAKATANLARLFIFGGASERALTVLAPALAKNPDDPVLLTLRGAARLHVNDRAGAIADTDRALALDPIYEEAVAQRAGLYDTGGEHEAAVALVSQALPKLPKSTNLRTILVDLYARQENLASAERLARELIAMQPSELRFRTLLAQLLVREKRLDDAQRSLEDAVRELPQSMEAKRQLVNFIAAERSPGDAAQRLRVFVSAAPEDAQLQLLLGETLLRAGSADDALKVYDGIVARGKAWPDIETALLREASIDLARHQLKEARAPLERVLRDSPRDTDALALRGSVSLAEGQPDAAIPDLRAAARDRPDAVGVQRKLAAAYEANGQVDLALQTLRAAAEQQPADPIVREELVGLLLRTRRADEAVAILQSAADKSPQDAEVLGELVQAQLAVRDLGAARASADKLKGVAPGAALSYVLAGRVERAENRFADARADLERALAIEPRTFEALEGISELDLTLGHAGAAIARVKQATEQRTGDARPVNLLGTLYAHEKQLPLAIVTLTHATTLAPRWSVPYRNLALAKYASADRPGAEAAYQRALELAPDDPRLVGELAEHYEADGKVDAALTLYQGWSRAHPQVVEVASDLAKLLVNYRTDRADLDLARGLTERFAASDDPRLLDANGWVSFKRGEYAAALPVLERAAERDPGAAEIRYHLGMTELRSGKENEARGDLQRALDGSRQYPWSDDARAALAGLRGHAQAGQPALSSRL